MAATGHPSRASPERIFETLNAYQKTAALKTAIELDVFTAIGQGTNSAAALAKKCQASERGIRILVRLSRGQRIPDEERAALRTSARFSNFSQQAVTRVYRLSRWISYSPGADGRFQGFDGHRPQGRLAGRRRHYHRARQSEMGGVRALDGAFAEARQPKASRKSVNAERRREMESARHRCRPRNVRRHDCKTQSQRGNFRRGLASRPGCGERECASRRSRTRATTPCRAMLSTWNSARITIWFC